MTRPFHKSPGNNRHAECSIFVDVSCTVTHLLELGIKSPFPHEFELACFPANRTRVIPHISTEFFLRIRAYLQ
jgi:hypothetical protein